PKMMRHWRERAYEDGIAPATERYGVGIWAWFAKHPALYGLGARTAVRALAWLGRKEGRLRKLPLAGGWTEGRDLPAPQGRTFQEQWRRRQSRSRRRP